MSALSFLFVFSVSLPAVWCQDYSYYYSYINTNDNNATITDDTTEATTIPASNTSEPQSNQTSPAETTATSTVTSSTTFPTQSPEMVSRHLLAWSDLTLSVRGSCGGTSSSTSCTGCTRPPLPRRPQRGQPHLEERGAREGREAGGLR